MTDLKPCPFCGGPARREKENDEYGAVWCDGEACMISPEVISEDSQEDADAAWNTRAADESDRGATLAGLPEVLEEAALLCASHFWYAKTEEQRRKTKALAAQLRTFAQRMNQSTKENK